MNIPRILAQAASSTGSIYKIVFTAMLLVELVRFRLRKRNVQDSLYRPRDSSYRAAGSLGLSKKRRV